MLNLMNRCKKFHELLSYCNFIKPELERLTLPTGNHSVMSTSSTIDFVSMDILPSDIPDDMFPVHNYGDGNCLPRAASILAYGNDHSYVVCLFVCWSLTSLCHSNGHIETMSAREINPFTALTRIRS